MSGEVFITEAIQRAASNNYPAWTIGITDLPTRRRMEHGNPGSWLQWDADTERIARNVEALFIARGMKGGTGGAGRADYVYIF